MAQMPGPNWPPKIGNAGTFKQLPADYGNWFCHASANRQDAFGRASFGIELKLFLGLNPSTNGQRSPKR